MNELIENFITDMFSPEYISNVRKSFSLFELFEYQNAYGKFVDIVLDESVSDIESRTSRFKLELHNQLDFLLGKHLIELVEETSVVDKLTILDALYRIQHLENYTAIDSFLERTNDPIDIMSLILEELTDLDQGYLLSILKTVQDRSIRLLKVFVLDKITNQESVLVTAPRPNSHANIVNRIRIFKQHVAPESIGISLVEAGMKPGLSFTDYLPYVTQQLTIDPKLLDLQIDFKSLGSNFLSIFYISSLEEDQFIKTYREISEQFSQDLNRVGKIEHEIVGLMLKVDEYRKMEDEKKRVSQESSSGWFGR